MLCSWFLIPALLVLSAPVFAQSAPTDSQTLQALLAEVRQLRKDLESTTAAAQRAQILLYHLQAQQDVARRAQQRLDDFTEKLSRVQGQEKILTAQVKRMEEDQESSQNSPEQKEMQAALPQFKAQLESLAAQDQELQAKKADAEQELRLEQAKLSTLQADLERLERALERPAGPSEATPQ
jgi:DNA repair exonuclease SbcCD ATPase subunit